MSRRRRRTSSLDPGRLGAAVLLTVSVIALGLSLYNPLGSRGTVLQAQTLDIEELPEIEQTTRTSQLKQATGDAPLVIEDNLPLLEPIVAMEPTPVPTLVRSAAPVSALPASRVRSVSSNETARSVTAASQSSAPLSIAIATTGGAVSVVASDLVAELRAAGRDVKLTSLNGAERPDVLLVLDVSATESSYAWYCEPGPSSNAVLANLLLEVLPHSAEDNEVTGPDAGFSCKEVHAGRAQTTAVLLELPRSLNSDEATAAISGAVQ